MSIYPSVDTRRKRRVGAPERASHALLLVMAPIEPRMDTNGHEYHLFMERLHSFFRSCTGSGIFASCGIQPPVKAQLPPATLHYRTAPPFHSLPSSPFSKDARRLCRAGAPERPSHALLPPLFSLPSTLTDAHCKVATHYLLLPPPSSLPYRRARARQPRTPPSPLLPTLY